MKTTLEQLIDKRKNRDEVVRQYRKDFLDCELSTAIDHCFYEAELWSYNKETLKNFRRYIDELCKKEVLLADQPVELLRKGTHLVIERLEDDKSLSDMQKKLRMHALIFLFRHLSKETGGAVKALQMPHNLAKISPAQEGGKKSASFDEVHAIIKTADSISNRDSLILKLIFQTEKSLQEILNLKCEDLNYEERTISGIQNIIDSDLMERLKDYVQTSAEVRDNCPYIFISNQGKPIYRTQVQKTLDKANQAAELPYRITTKMIQRTKQYERLNRET